MRRDKRANAPSDIIIADDGSGMTPIDEIEIENSSLSGLKKNVTSLGFVGLLEFMLANGITNSPVLFKFTGITPSNVLPIPSNTNSWPTPLRLSTCKTKALKPIKSSWVPGALLYVTLSRVDNEGLLAEYTNVDITVSTDADQFAVSLKVALIERCSASGEIIDEPYREPSDEPIENGPLEKSSRITVADIPRPPIWAIDTNTNEIDFLFIIFRVWVQLF